MPLLKHIYIIVFLAVTLSSCNHIRTRHPSGHGYPYPESYIDQDTNDYFYPLRTKLKKRDSLSYSREYLLYKAFNEPNLSLKYMGTPTYRIAYAEAFGRNTMITLSGRRLTVKDAEAGNPFPEIDTNKLTKFEKQQYQILTRWYPIDTDKVKSVWRRHYLDSLVKVYPMLLDPKYYKYLLEKASVKSQTAFTYSTVSVILNDKQYEDFVKLLDSSGYWRLPYHIVCEEPPMDGEGFILEANTEDAYNAVGASSCGVDSVAKFKEACQRLINYTVYGTTNPVREKRISVSEMDNNVIVVDSLNF